jgi:hypothetical protein
MEGHIDSLERVKEGILGVREGVRIETEYDVGEMMWFMDVNI